ncbi:MAG: hypothetical protein KGV46_02635 [Pasteurella sp.]|nr:hypothetical protein [Pasteurella sp.]
MSNDVTGADKLIPYSSHITPEIIKIKGGSYMMVFRIAGISYIGKSQNIIDGRIRQLNKLISQLKAPLRYNVYLHSHCIRHEYEPELDDGFERNSFVYDLNKQYVNEKIKSTRNIKTDYFLSIIYRPYRKIGGMSAYRNTRSQIEIFENQAIDTLSKIKNLILNYFDEYDVNILTTFEKNNLLYSEQLKFLNLIFNLSNSDVPVLNAQISEYLPTATLRFGNNEIIQVSNAGEIKYAAILSFSEYPNQTSAGILQPFIEKPWRMIISQSYVPIDKSESEDWLKREFRRLEATDDASDADLGDIANALEGVQADKFIIGEYCWTVMLIADDIKTLRSMLSEATSTLSDCGFTSSVNELAKLSSYCSQLPGNLRYRPRDAKLSSVNVAHLLPYQVQNRGKQWNNPWGCAVSMFKTVTDEVFYFNFHDTEKDSNSTGELVLGNTCISGQSGAGKTVLMSFLLAQSQRYKTRPRLILFDKDLGSSVFVKAAGGQYSQIKLGTPTGFNPFHLENTAMNRAFLGQLIRAILNNDEMPVTAAEKNEIYEAIEQVMNNPKELRDIEAFTNYLPDGDNSVRQRLFAWTEGEYSWVFNNAEDNFTMNSNIFGLDYTEFLEIKDIRTPIMMYLFHRIELLLDGSPLIIGVDEAWYPLSDPEFLQFLENKERTIRKENGLIVYATQSPSDFFEGLPKSFIEQIATQIFLPNPEAKKDIYVETLGLSLEEYELIRSMHKNSREFLIKYQGETTHCKLDLKGIDAVNVLSGSQKRAEHAITLQNEYGDEWLDKYYQTVLSIGEKHEKETN